MSRILVVIAALHSSGCSYLANELNDYIFHNPTEWEKRERKFMDEAVDIVKEHGDYASADLLIEQYNDLIDDYPDEKDYRWDGVIVHFLLKEKRYQEALPYLRQIDMQRSKYLPWSHLFTENRLTCREAMHQILVGLNDPTAKDWE